jgi:cytochrome P450
MTAELVSDVYYDPFDQAIFADPYPTYRRLRDEAPLYHNDRYGFYAVSRAEDVQRVIVDRANFSSAKATVLEWLLAGIDVPPGMFIWEDAPRHTRHRGVLSRVFTPRRVAEIEPQVRAYTQHTLDQLLGRDEFDFVADIGAHIPMRVIGMVLGIPEDDQQFIRDESAIASHNEAGRPAEHRTLDGHLYEAYIDWRADHPSDDLMTDLLNVTFEDESGETRRLTRAEVLTFVMLLDGAGAETTATTIAWAGKALADHPDQRRELVEDPGLIPDAIEELLRFEPPFHMWARSVVEDAQFHGVTVPAGSALACVSASANHDERRFDDPERFDIHRRPTGHLAFSIGAHYCLGAALARLETRVVLEELLLRFPTWEVDDERSSLAPTTTLRGWKSVIVGV